MSLGFTVLLALASGCASNIHVTRLTSGPAASIEKTLKVYDLGDKVDRPYEIVGVVSATGDRGGVHTKARKQMLKEAASLGAEALVGYYYDDEKTTSTDAWAGALAVKFLPSGAAAPAPSKAVVAIPHVVIGDDLGAGKKAEKADAIARKLARFVLAKKGYYAVFTDDKLSPSFPDDLKNVNAPERFKFGHPEADLVLAVRLGERHVLNVGLFAGASQALATAIFSKSTNAVTWRNAASGTAGDIGTMFSVAHLLVPSAKTIQSMRAAFEYAFATLPNLSSPPVQK